MRSDEIGMVTDKVKQITVRLDSFISSGNKIESSFSTLSETAKKAYSSLNSLTLNSHNSMIIEGVHVNTRNIKSYNEYIKRKVTEYSRLDDEAKVALSNIKID
jgi:hypothetical protein